MKIKEMQEILKKKNLDYAMFFNTSNDKKDYFVNYFSGLDIELVFVVIPKDKKPFIIVSELEIGKAKKYSRIRDIISFNKDLFELIKEHIGEKKKIGVNYSSVTLNEAKALRKNLKAKLTDISKESKELRNQKTTEEINIIKKACKVTDEIFTLVTNSFDSFNTELDIKNFIETNMRDRGYRPAFDTIVNSGSNASNIHYISSDEKLKKGFCIMDFGVNIEGYNSDMTRTVYIGKPKKEEIETYNNLKQLQEKCIKSIRLGMKYSDLDNIARKELGERFVYGLGHGLGLEVHESPSVSPKSKDKIMKGHVFTVEPGIHVKDKFGMRIEDDIYINEKGEAEVLTKSSKELFIFN